MLIEKVGQMLIDLMTVFGQRLLGLHTRLLYQTGIY